MFRWLGRSIGVVLVLLILMATPCAFWTFNLERVALDPQTYKAPLHSTNAYSGLLPAFIDEIAESGSLDPAISNVLNTLLNYLSTDDWGEISTQLLPKSWLQNQIEGNINRFFDWVNGGNTMPDIQFNLGELKTNLKSSKANTVAQTIVSRMPPCNSADERTIQAATSDAGIETIPLCNPSTTETRQMVSSKLAGGLNFVGNELPERWDLMEQIHKTTVAPPNRRVSEFEVSQFRASIWLQSRLSVLLFLIPLALMSLIVIVTVRSGKEFFRWSGWVLILSGLITLVPVAFVPAWIGSMMTHNPMDFLEGFGENARLMGVLFGGMLSSIGSGLTLAVLIQVAVVIVIGFIAAGISILLPPPPPDVTLKQVELEALTAQQMIQQGVCTPPGMAPWQPGATPAPGSLTPQLGPPVVPPIPPAPAAPNPLDDRTLPPIQ